MFGSVIDKEESKLAVIDPFTIEDTGCKGKWRWLCGVDMEKNRVNKSQDDEDDINHYGFDFGFK